MYMESGNSETRMTRLYVEDVELLKRKARTESVRRNRDVPIAEVAHEQFAQLRLDERAAEQERGTHERH